MNKYPHQLNLFETIEVSHHQFDFSVKKKRHITTSITRVPGGYIYITDVLLLDVETSEPQKLTSSSVFVPNPNGNNQ